MHCRSYLLGLLGSSSEAPAPNRKQLEPLTPKSQDKDNRQWCARLLDEVKYLERVHHTSCGLHQGRVEPRVPVDALSRQNTELAREGSGGRVTTGFALERPKSTSLHAAMTFCGEPNKGSNHRHPETLHPEWPGVQPLSPKACSLNHPDLIPLLHLLCLLCIQTLGLDSWPTHPTQ